MPTTEHSVLHVLPHPGGGGETYVDLLSEMPGYRFERVYLGSSPEPSARELARGVARAHREGRKHDLVHVHGEAAAGLCLPLLATQPSVVTLHGLHLVRRLSGLKRKAAVLNLRALLRAADRTICVSEAEHDELARAVGAARTKRAVVIRNGVPIPPARTEAERTSARDALDLTSDEVVGIWVGSLDQRKDPLTAVRAANEAGVTLLVVGDGPLREDVEREAGGHVRVLGHSDVVPRLLVAADLYVSTSRREGLSVSLLEAMARGLASAVTTLPENLEAIGDTGIDVAAGDQRALVTALEELGRDGRRRRALGEAARSRVIELFGVSEMVALTCAYYDALVASAH